jgi:hypothetical protein
MCCKRSIEKCPLGMFLCAKPLVQIFLGPGPSEKSLNYFMSFGQREEKIFVEIVLSNIRRGKSHLTPKDFFPKIIFRQSLKER